jgi:hypothetical protein
MVLNHDKRSGTKTIRNGGGLKCHDGGLGWWTLAKTGNGTVMGR